MGAFKHGPGCDCCGSDPCKACGNCAETMPDSIYGYDPLGVNLADWPPEDVPRYLNLNEVFPFCFNYQAQFSIVEYDYNVLYILGCVGGTITLSKQVTWFGTLIYNHAVAAASFSCDPASFVFNFPAQASSVMGEPPWTAHTISIADTPF